MTRVPVMKGWLQGNPPVKKMQLIPPSGLYLGTQSGMTQFVEWIEGPEDSEKEDWGFKTRPSLLEWDRWWAA